MNCLANEFCLGAASLPPRSGWFIESANILQKITITKKEEATCLLRMPTMAPISTGPMACWAIAEGLNKGGKDRVCPAGSFLAEEVLVKGEVVLLEWHPCTQEYGDQPVRAPAGTLCSTLQGVAWVPEFCCGWQVQSGLLHFHIRSVFSLLRNCASSGDRHL